MENSIIRGTTPTISYTFKSISTSDIDVAYLTITVDDQIVIEKGIESATIESGKISWKLTQEDTLAVSRGQAKMMLNWKLADGTRGASDEVSITFAKNQKEEVI